MCDAAGGVKRVGVKWEMREFMRCMQSLESEGERGGGGGMVGVEFSAVAIGAVAASGPAGPSGRSDWVVYRDEDSSRSASVSNSESGDVTRL